MWYYKSDVRSVSLPPIIPLSHGNGDKMRHVMGNCERDIDRIDDDLKQEENEERRERVCGRERERAKSVITCHVTRPDAHSLLHSILLYHI